MVPKKVLKECKRYINKTSELSEFRMTAKIVTTIMPPRIVTTIMPPRIVTTIDYPEPADPDQEIDVSNFYGDVSWSDEEQQDDDDTPRHTRLDSLGMPMPDSGSDSDSDSASDFISDSNFMDEDGNIDEYAKKMYYEYLAQYNEYLTQYKEDSHLRPIHRREINQTIPSFQSDSDSEPDWNDEVAVMMYYDNKNIELEDEYLAQFDEEGPVEDTPEEMDAYYQQASKEYSDELNAHYEEIPV